MNRQDIYKEIEERMGSVPGFFKCMTDSELDIEWQAMKLESTEQPAVPPKYRELIGLGIAAASQSRYGVYYHLHMAKLFGATDAEIEDAARFSKESVGWSTYLQGLDYDYDDFKKEVRSAAEYVRKQQEKMAA